MRIGNAGRNQANYRFASPRPIHSSWAGAAVSPHSVTARLTYTVPGGRYAVVENILLRIRRAAVATTPGIVVAYLNYVPVLQGWSAEHCSVWLTTNSVNDISIICTMLSFTMITGDALWAYTSDSSTGGSCDYSLTVKITEYNF